MDSSCSWLASSHYVDARTQDPPLYVHIAYCRRQLIWLAPSRSPLRILVMRVCPSGIRSGWRLERGSPWPDRIFEPEAVFEYHPRLVRKVRFRSWNVSSQSLQGRLGEPRLGIPLPCSSVNTAGSRSRSDVMRLMLSSFQPRCSLFTDKGGLRPYGSFLKGESA